ncbi:MAG: RdgB/HAM1 family non-canonical purine NTP pyrophosphatase [Bacteroidales bacterium]|nr:RdgB/HAM1 family non-canonical purine NTP pyrophosphatase [Bacteroidales bacterium]MCF8389553.1 RdgB/HAM1 family non-canonical purine NTP pyrophosphatase [Bacteroidales bacterium]
MELIFATNNKHKLSEIRNVIGDNYKIIGLSEAGIEGDIPEDYNTLEENAFQKANFIYEKYGGNCFADDTGLEVDALDGRPGVYSARYSRMGDIQFPELEANKGNIKKLLIELDTKELRTARFRTVIALILNERKYLFEGIVNGIILKQPSGSGGFGYDPVFQALGYKKSFAEMDIEQKNSISHRAIATRKLVEFLKTCTM